MERCWKLRYWLEGRYYELSARWHHRRYWLAYWRILLKRKWFKFFWGCIMRLPFMDITSVTRKVFERKDVQKALKESVDQWDL